MDFLAVVQARMGSSRLPGKMLTPLAGRPALWHVLRRLEEVPSLDRVVLAVPDTPPNDPLERFSQTCRATCYRGSDEDVLERMFWTARSYGPRAVVRITGDCTLLDPYVVEAVIGLFRSGQYDYASNCLVPSFPDGLDVEVMSLAALEEAWLRAAPGPEREHVTPYIRLNPDRFNTVNLHNPVDLSALCWALDTPRDLSFQQAVYEHLDPDDPADFRFQRVLAILEQHPEAAGLNASSVRDEKLLGELPAIFQANQGTVNSHPWKEAR